MLFSVIFAGGAFGALTRYLLSLVIATRLGSRFPWATLAVNLSGCFLLGLVLHLLQASDASALLRSFLTVGVLGSFTTFSSFSVEAVALVERGRFWQALVYITVSCLIGLAALLAGSLLGLAVT